MFRTLVNKEKIPVQRYIRKGEENKKGTRRFWRSINYTLKYDEVWLNKWRVKDGKDVITFNEAPTQEKIREKIDKQQRGYEQRIKEEAEYEQKVEEIEKIKAKQKQERIEKDNKKKIRKAELDKERKEIEDASNIMLESWQNDNKSIIEPLKIMLKHYSGIQRLKIPQDYLIPGENWKDDKTHMDVERTQIDNAGRGKKRVRKSHIYVTILVPKDKDFHLSQLNRVGDWELGFKVAEMPADDYKSEDGGIVKSGLFTVVKGKGFWNDYRDKWYE